MAKFYICGGRCEYRYAHPWDWDGECADATPSDTFHLLPSMFEVPGFFPTVSPDDEVLTWEERLKADLWGDHVTG